MTEKKELVIKSKNLGLYYFADKRREDFRSFVLNKVRLKDIKKKENWVLNDISFEGYSGEILGVIGSNGTGKTTLCRILGGLLKPDKGTIDINGSVSALLALGAGFDEELTGKENVYLNGSMLGFSKEEIKTYYDTILEFSGLEKFMDVPMKKYSTGMRIRLGFSIAAMLAPETLVLDETLSTGDYEFQTRSAAKMEELISKARMIVVVTHDMEFVRKRCTRAIWIDRGFVKTDGDPSVVADLYLKSIIPAAPVAMIEKPVQPEVEYTETQADIKDECVIKAENIGIFFKIKKNKFWALKNVSFTIKKGEIVGIIGHNGAGKSTLCRTLTGIYKPNEGSLDVKGKTSALLSLGSGFNEQLPAGDNIMLNGMMIGIPRKKLKELQPKILEFAELGEHAEKPVKNYSSGMKSKLGFSIAAAIQPELFIIDEALSAGDAAFQKKASETIQQMIKNAEAVIVVTHGLDFVEKVCTRAIWFDHGKILFDGDPKEAVKMYKGVYA